MNWFVLSAGIVALMTTLGHFTAGRKMFFLPMMNAEFDQVSKKVMHCVFHYVSVFLITSTFTLLAVGLGKFIAPGHSIVVNFIAINYAGCAVWQLVIAVTSGIPKAPFKLFQWVFFAVIAVLSLLGTM